MGGSVGGLGLGGIGVSMAGLGLGGGGGGLGIPTIPDLTGQTAAEETGRAARDAAQAQVQAARMGIEEQRRQFDIQQENLQPFREIGLQGLQQYQEALGTSPEGVPQLAEYTPFTLNDMYQDPGYQFRLQQGTQAIERANAARGGRLSGGTLAELANYGQGLASQEYGAARNRYIQDYGLGQQTALQQYGLESGARSDYLNRLASLGGIGQSTSATMAGLSSNYANALSNLYGNMGQAQAQGIIGQGQAAAAGSLGLRNTLMDIGQIGAAAYGMG